MLEHFQASPYRREVIMKQINISGKEIVDIFNNEIKTIVDNIPNLLGFQIKDAEYDIKANKEFVEQITQLGLDKKYNIYSYIAYPNPSGQSHAEYLRRSESINNNILTNLKLQNPKTERHYTLLNYQKKIVESYENKNMHDHASTMIEYWKRGEEAPVIFADKLCGMYSYGNHFSIIEHFKSANDEAVYHDKYIKHMVTDKELNLTDNQRTVLDELHEMHQFTLEDRIRKAWTNGNACDFSFTKAGMYAPRLEKLYEQSNLEAIGRTIETRTKPISMAEMKRISHEKGYHFFDKDTMEMFNTTIETKGNLHLNKYFITSTRMEIDSPKEYKIREFDYKTGRTNTIENTHHNLKAATEHMLSLRELSANQKEVIDILRKEPLEMGITADKLKGAWIHGQAYELSNDEKEYIHNYAPKQPVLAMKEKSLIDKYEQGNKESLQSVITKIKSTNITYKGISR